jgi:hypothetical protein
MTNAERRGKIRPGLSSLYLPFYDALCAALPDEWAPFQGLRTVEEQNNLFALGRSKPGKIVTKAQGGSSPHNYGCATDWTIFVDGKPVWMKPEDPRWQVYADAIRKAGAQWGGDWNNNGQWRDERFLDMPHNELPINCSWKHVYVEFSKNGMRAAQEYIEKRVTQR